MLFYLMVSVSSPPALYPYVTSSFMLLMDYFIYFFQESSRAAENVM